MTSEQWQNLRPTQKIKLRQEPYLRVALVRKDHMARWIVLVLQDDQPIRSCLIATDRPDLWDIN
jgi:hypothetical protein